MAELIQMFVEEMPGRVSLVEAHWRSRNLDELRRVAHQLKGACGGYGFPSVGHAAGTLEAGLTRPRGSTEQADLDSISRQVQDLVALCRRITTK
jgi:HPt (histidine-containing phosphotransfer) domain-containing protein